MPCVIVISGFPCAGKTRLASELRTTLGWPLIAKDELKEVLFDALGCGDRAWSKRISVAAYAAMFATARELLDVGHSCMIEGNFRWDANREQFALLAAMSHVRTLQVFCTSDVTTLANRFRARATAGTRHPGQVDEQSAPELLEELRLRPPLPLPLDAAIIEWDSSRGDLTPRALASQVRERALILERAAAPDAAT